MDGNKIIGTEEDLKEVRASKTKITEGSDEAVCRICLCSEQEDPEGDLGDGDPNPLISPCNCMGTMGIIHFKCLRHWLETKRSKREHKGQTTIKFNKLDCELCKQPFPFKILYKNQIVDIVGVEKPDKNFIILESLSNEQQKVFHVINTENLVPIGDRRTGSNYRSKIFIGRG